MQEEPLQRVSEGAGNTLAWDWPHGFHILEDQGLAGD